MANGDAKAVIRQAEDRVKTHASLAAKWRDWRKPLGERRAPNPVPFPAQVALRMAGYGSDPQNLVKGHALKAAAVNEGLAGQVQRTIERLVGTLDSLRQPDKTINTVYLHKIADSTIAAGRACQRLRAGRSPSKNETRLAAAWVVVLGCGLVPRLDQRVKKAAIEAYPLFSAGKRLNEMVDPAQAIHVAYLALGVA